ncbi:MAG TPA: hypothetical protein VMU39_26005 [Solirubrobacteraceae bacterium]|nr:hypothetical protein [Solirubrobacteraceae bacterium]
MAINKNVRNVAILFVIAAVIVILPGGGTGAQVIVQAISLLFLATFAWIAARLYREHRVALYSLGDGRRALLYSALAVAAVTWAAKGRMWTSTSGKIVWFALLAGAAYAVFAVVMAARKYD